MYAIIRTGGKQYRVEPGDTLKVEKLNKNLGDVFDLTEVLTIGGDKTYIGEPTVKDAKVVMVVTNQSRAPKVIVFKKKRRQGYRKMQGHKQFYTELFVKSIVSPEGEEQTDKKANVFNAAKKIEELNKTAEVKRIERHSSKSNTTEAPIKKKAAKKSTAKKKAVKKKVTKKAVAKKTAVKKTTTKKKTAKKTATKKATKK